MPKEISKERYISPEKRKEIIDELKKITKNVKKLQQSNYNWE